MDLRLAKDQAIIAEKPTNSTSTSFAKKSFTIKRLAKVISYHEETGAHWVRYASSVGSNRNHSSTNIYMENEDILNLNDGNIRLEDVEFHGREVLLILATRDYCILHRNRRYNDLDNSNDDNHFENDSTALLQKEKELFASTSCSKKTLPLGLRVESDCLHQSSPSSSCEVYTILSSSLVPVYHHPSRINVDYEEGDASMNLDDSNNTFFVQDSAVPAASNSNNFHTRYNLVSDTGEVLLNVPDKKIKGHDILLHRCYNSSSSSNDTSSSSASSSARQHASTLERAIVMDGGGNNGPIGLLRSTNPNLFHFGRSASAENNLASQSSRSSSVQQKGVLRRTWSALSSLQNMHPLHVSYTTGSDSSMSNNDDNSNEIEICTDVATGEKPPHLSVNFSLFGHVAPHVSFEDTNVTLYHGLQRLIKKQMIHSKRQKNNNIMAERKCKLFYSINFVGINRCRQGSTASEDEKINDFFIEEYQDSNLTWNSAVSDETAASFVEKETLYNAPSTTTWYSHRNVISSSDNSKTALSKCEGLDETCVQCLELLTALASHSNHIVAASPHSRSDADDYFSAMFVSEALTNKLMEQLGDPLTVVGGALPDWCSIIPVYAPRVFSHTSRRRLLERAAFGMSRAAFCQQESKVAVGPLRQRMAVSLSQIIFFLNLKYDFILRLCFLFFHSFTVIARSRSRISWRGLFWWSG